MWPSLKGKIMQKLELVDVIQRSMLDSKENIIPLTKYLGMELSIPISKTNSRSISIEIANYLRKMGSNDIATLLRGGDGVSYDEVVLDVGKKLKADVKLENSVEENEEEILWKLFSDSLDKMSKEEKSNMFQSMGFNENQIPFGATSALIIQLLLKQYGGFAIYRTSVIVANMVSRAILGSGLTFAANATITRSIGTLLGPIGWIASGLWLAVDIAGPAFRKTVPAIVHIATLRQVLTKRITIGVVGCGSSGKDALLSSVFNLDSNVHPIAGSTKEAKAYPLCDNGTAHIVNYPGFHDHNNSVNIHTNDFLHQTDVFIMVVNAIDGISGIDVETLEKLKSFKKPILICLNKIDLARNDEQRKEFYKTAQERLSGYKIIETAFDPDPRLLDKKIGCEEVYNWVVNMIKKEGKDASSINAFSPN